MIVKVRSTGGTAASEFSSESTTWGELIKEVQAKGISLDGKKVMATTAENETIDYTDEVDGPNVALPSTGVISLMLVTTKVKSGSL